MQETPTLRGRGSLRDFLAVLFRRRWVIVTVFAVTTVTVVCMNLSRPVFYESTGRVLVKRGVRDNLLQPSIRTLTWEEELASEVETIKSNTLLIQAQKVLDHERQAAGRPTVRIEGGKVDASVLGQSNVLAMSYQDRDPKVAEEVTQALVTAYVDY